MRSLFTVLLTVLLASFAFAQDSWLGQGAFPADSSENQIHGIAVDPDGKIWVQSYYAYARDTIFVPKKNAQTPVRALHIFNPDGSQAAFSPMFFVTVGATTDTLGGATISNAWSANTGRGLKMALDGHILATYFGTVYKINYQTGEGIGKMVVSTASSGVAPASTTDGRVFTAFVVGGNPIQEWTADFNLIGNAVDASVGFSRSFEVSADGNTIYWAGYTNHAIYKYNRPDEFSSFGVPDTILKGFDSESFCWHPVTGDLWASAGSNNDKPNRFPNTVTNYSIETWYGYDVLNNVITDSVKWDSTTGATKPRGIGFSPDGKIAYVGSFTDTKVGVQKFIKNESSLQWEHVGVLGEFTLENNYPNPFNPTTEIKFTLNKPGQVELNVFNMAGEHVATLLNNRLIAGTHTVGFDGTGLASGTYIYRLTMNGYSVSKKMSLVK